MVADDVLFEIRSGRVDDLPFIKSAWVKSHGKQNIGSTPTNVASHIHGAEYPSLVDAALRRSSAYVACNKDDLAQIFGFLVYELQDRPAIHYLYVKEAFRRLGVAKALVAHALEAFSDGPVWVTHWSTHWSWRLKKLQRHAAGAEWEFNPYRMFFPKGTRE